MIYFKAGGGHLAAARALETVIRRQARPWRVRLVDLFDVLDPRGAFKRATGLNPEDVYNKRLARGWTLGLAQELILLQLLIRASHNTITRRLRQHWRATRPDLVISVVPNFNRPMYEALAAVLPAVPYVTILTDLADHPPHFWIEPHQAQHLICGTPKAVSQARRVAGPQATIHETSGMIIAPQFYGEAGLDRVAEEEKCGLDPARPTGLVLFGGHGSKAMCGIARELADIQLIFICGHNAGLAAKLRGMKAAAPRHIVGYTSDVPYYMALSDFFIGKPGPGSLSEAVHRRLPVIVVRNAYTMPQERYNSEWVLQHGLGVVLKSFKDIRKAVGDVTGRLDAFRANLARMQNLAVYEIPQILDGILRAQAPRAGSLRRPCTVSRPSRIASGAPRG